MIRDEIDGVGLAKVEPLTRARYRRLQFGVSAAFGVVLLACWIALRYGSQFEFLNGLGSFIFWAAVFLGKFTVDAYLKWRGLSLSGPTVQVFGKLGAAPSGADVPNAAVEIRSPRDLMLVFGAGCLVVSLPTLAVGCGFLAQRFGTHDADFAPVAIGWTLALVAVGVVSGGVGVWFLTSAETPKRYYRVDPAGFTNFTTDTFIPWAQVANHRVITDHDALGDPQGITHELTDWHGASLVRFQLGQNLHRERFLRFLQARMPKPVKDEAWDEP